MEYISTKAAADKWNISQRRVNALCSENRIAGASRVGQTWIIPEDAVKPIDARTTKEKPADNKARPFLKWAGGKNQLLDEIRLYYPFRQNHNIIKYAEPFVGGGAVLFDILNTYKLEAIYISDINNVLINTYITIRDNLESLISNLQKLENRFLPLVQEDRKQFYLECRSKFNELKHTKKNSTELAALMIFLNKTCFNGLYRVNRNGNYNVPMGAYKNPLICDENNLRNVSRLLQNVQIVCGDYKESESFIDNKTFVYFDPPYRPLNPTSNFTSYTKELFDDNKQLELAKFVQTIDNKGARIVVSNSDPKNTNENDDFFENAYQNQNIKRVTANRMINSNSKKRGKINELLISNY